MKILFAQDWQDYNSGSESPGAGYNLSVNSSPLKWLESQHLQGEKKESKEDSKVFE